MASGESSLIFMLYMFIYTYMGLPLVMYRYSSVKPCNVEKLLYSISTQIYHNFVRFRQHILNLYETIGLLIFLTLYVSSHFQVGKPNFTRKISQNNRVGFTVDL